MPSKMVMFGCQSVKCTCALDFASTVIFLRLFLLELWIKNGGSFCIWSAVYVHSCFLDSLMRNEIFHVLVVWRLA